MLTYIRVYTCFKQTNTSLSAQTHAHTHTHHTHTYTQVTSYITRDHLDLTFQERTIHLAIYTQSLDGGRELYRHFVRRPDGVCVCVRVCVCVNYHG